MKTDLEKKIYQAQCIGNVEPIEYMVAYPNLFSLIDGQNIKFSDQIIFEKYNLTNSKIKDLVNQMSNWLDIQGIKPKERVTIKSLKFPLAEIVLFGIWNVGATVVITGSKDIKEAQKETGSKHIIEPPKDLLKTLVQFPKKYMQKYKPLLGDEALIFFYKGKGLRLSHYNLLVNTGSTKKEMKIESRSRIFCDIKSDSVSWIIFRAILPIYAGCIYTEKNPDITISDKSKNSTYFIREDIENIRNYRKNEVAICPENTAVLSIGGKPIHLSNFSVESNLIKIQGHSVMMGYLDERMNEKSFNENYLEVSI